ncbi:hypothetical protein HC928_24310 [bacterium]|nr:hypothetical protein [bacterium]
MQQGLDRGAQQGIRQGVQRTVANILRARFGELDAELAAAVEQLAALPDEELAIALVQLSREALLAKVRTADEESPRPEGD